MAVTYKLIQTVTVGSGGAASIDFTSIPQTFTDLVIQISSRSNRAAATSDNLEIEFNGVSASLSFRYLSGNGSTATSANGAYGFVGDTTSATATATVFSSHSVYIPNYAGSTNKPHSADSVTENNATEAVQGLVAGLWSNTAAITSLSLFPRIGSLLLEHSSASLYGIKNS
jgi:hypothetical protein